LKTKKGLRSWLGILNYTRTYIPNLGKLAGPLYNKTSAKAKGNLQKSDWALIDQIKDLVQHLPAMELPPQKAYIVLETDGCAEGWGGVAKWRPNKYAARNTEKVFAYASGKFDTPQSTIDAEIATCINSLEKFKIHYLEQHEISLRTDCDAIVRFYNKIANKQPSRIRWIKFIDYLTGTGVKVNIEHIDGKNNILADQLSRI
ncbi:hypothetical protein ES332_A13G213600v1, partial [Gossypium tomentosum]